MTEEGGEFRKVVNRLDADSFSVMEHSNVVAWIHHNAGCLSCGAGIPHDHLVRGGCYEGFAVGRGVGWVQAKTVVEAYGNGDGGGIRFWIQITDGKQIVHMA